MERDEKVGGKGSERVVGEGSRSRWEAVAEVVGSRGSRERGRREGEREWEGAGQECTVREDRR